MVPENQPFKKQQVGMYASMYKRKSPYVIYDGDDLFF